MTEFRLFNDESFHYETLRILGAATGSGSDITEVLQAIPKIVSGDFESWYTAFYDLATRVDAQAQRLDSSTASGRVSVRDACFRASSYYRVAEFYLHGNASDPRIMECWTKQTAAFDAAIALLPNPGRRLSIHTTHGFRIPAIFYPASQSASSGPRPTLLLGNGFDGAQEEMLHHVGFAALERGFNVITYEGPGQPTVRRYQGLGFIPDWERVVTPVVDYLHTYAKELNVDLGKLGLWGNSMGGMLGLRAAAFEKRLKAFIACDGVWSVDSALPEPFLTAVKEGRSDEFWRTVTDGTAPTSLRWMLTHGFWSLFDEGSDKVSKPTPDLQAFIDVLRQFHIADVVDMVSCKVLVADAEGDIFFKGQPEKVANVLGDKATYHAFKHEDGAGSHCQVGASSLLAQVSLDWFDKTVNA